MDFDEYRTHDATSLAKLVADKQVSAAELLATAQGRAAAVNPKLNAIVREVPASPTDDLTGPFAGVPFLIKDLAQDYAGLPTSAGSRALMSLNVAEHATVVPALDRRGPGHLREDQHPGVRREGNHRAGGVGTGSQPWEPG